ncbi:MAG: hypothetical protein JWM80_6295 [Cyanobacteria bacterium RYN_339]|nr:hypothetical protein [Cyanobacteria bacterium RYN_339]
MSLNVSNTPRLPVKVVAPVATPTPTPAPAPTATPAPEAKPGFKARLIGGTMRHLHDTLVNHPTLNKLFGTFMGPYIKHMFNAPAKDGGPVGPPALKPQTVAQAKQIMIDNFKPAEGKTVIAISGGGATTVHCFVVTGVKDGKVQITQAIAQTNGKPEDYHGIGGFIRKLEDKFFHNPAEQMKGVVVEDWEEYAARSKRNSVVLLEMDADPAKVQATLKKLQGLVGKPYDQTMLANDPATPASESAMYCTEISAWFVNQLKPGTIKTSTAMGGYPVFQVADHMRAADVNGGPLKILFNGENRLDVKNADPVPKAG